MAKQLQEIRICYIHVPGYIEYNDLDGEAKMNHFGLTIRRSLLKMGFNATFNPVPSLFSSDGNDCIGQMQRNQSDVSVLAFEHPFIAPNIKTGPAIGFSKDTMLTAYDKEKFGNHSTRVMDFLEGFSPDAWIITILSMALLYFLILATLMSRRWMDGPRRMRLMYRQRFGFFKALHDTNDMLIASVLKQMSCCCNVIPRRYTIALFTGMCMIGYYSGFYLTGMIKTEMVVTEPPPTYNSYQDLVDHDVIPMWLPQFGGEQRFVKSRRGSASRKLWDAAVKRGLDKSFIKSTSPGGLMSVLLPLMERKAVIVTIERMRSAIVANWCAYLRNSGLYPNINFYWRQDAEAKEHLRTTLYSAFAPKSVVKAFNRLLAKAFESGTLEKDLFGPVESLIATAGGYASQVEECKSGVIVEKDHEMVAIGITHYWDLCLICILSLCVALIVLMIERLIRMLMRPERVIRRRRSA